MDKLPSNRSNSSRCSSPFLIILLSCLSILISGLLLILFNIWILFRPSSSLPFHLLEPFLYTLLPASVSTGFFLLIVSCCGIAAVSTEKRAVTAIVSTLTFWWQIGTYVILKKVYQLMKKLGFFCKNLVCVNVN